MPSQFSMNPGISGFSGLRRAYALTGPFFLEMVAWGAIILLSLAFSFHFSRDAHRADFRIRSLSRISDNLTSLTRTIELSAHERIGTPGLLDNRSRSAMEGLYRNEISSFRKTLDHPESLSPQARGLLDMIERRAIPIHQELLDAAGPEEVLSVISKSLPRLTFPLLNLSYDINGEIHLASIAREEMNQKKQDWILAGMVTLVLFLLRVFMYFLGSRRKEEVYLRWAFEKTSDMVALLDSEGRVIDVNPSFSEFSPSISGNLIGQTIFGLASGHTVFQIMVEQWGSLDARDHELFRRDIVLSNREGVEHCFSSILTPVKDGKSEIRTYEWRATDLTVQKKIEGEIDSQREWFKTTLNSIGDGVIATDTKGAIIFMNRVSQGLIGVSEEEVTGRPVAEVFRVVNEKTLRPAPIPLERVLSGFTISGRNISTGLVLKNGSLVSISDSAAPIRNRHGEIIGVIFVFQEVTERKKAQKALWNMTYHDHLTGLPNDLLFRERLSQRISEARARRQKIAVLVMDVDHFKKINDVFGHTKGNELLQALSCDLESQVKTDNTLTRLGGDEFLIFQPEFEDLSGVTELANRILESVRKPVVVGDHVFNLSVSIGISVFPDDGETPDELIKNADAAMNSVKDHGRNDFRFYSLEMNANAILEIQMKDDLVNAIENDRLFLLYQPKVDGRSGTVVGVEALVRWESEKRGFMLPKDFISIAEEHGILPVLGEWVLRKALQDGRKWQEGNQPLPVSVNVSIRQLIQKDFCNRVLALLEETGFDPRYLVLEVTESVFAREFPEIQEKLLFLCGHGIRISLDDFGTGYASLSYLSRFPIQEIKIDKSFIARMVSDPREAEVVKAVLSFGKALDLSIVAEGVENLEQVIFLLQNECPLMQGFYFSRGLPFEEITSLTRGKVFSERLTEMY